MTVLSGGTRPGARSMLRALLGGVFALFGLFAGGCGNNQIHYGTAVVTVSADKGPFTAYVAEITSFYLTQNTGNIGYSFAGNGYGRTIDFVKVADQSELFGALAIAEGTYVSATLTMNFGSGGANYIASQIYVDVNGTSQLATLVDSTGATPASVAYTIKFDPANPLVIKRGSPVRLDIHFDMSASSIVDTTSSPPKVTVRPYVTMSTQPDPITKPLRSRGEFVTADTQNGNFTINAVSFFDSPSYTSNPQGAIEIETTAQTTYNVNGRVFRGAAGLAAMTSLPINTIVAAVGSLGDISAQKPVLNATEVYAGVAIENLLASRLIGTVVSRSGNTFHVHNAELIETATTSSTITTPTGVLVEFLNDATVTVDSTTLVSVDGHPEVTGTLDLLSVGQRVDIEGVATVDPTTKATTVNAVGGILRLSSTPAWGTLSSAQAGTATVNLVTLGDADASVLNFAGTGAGGVDAVANSYIIDTGTTDLTGQATGNPLYLFDGLVNGFGSAPPDFTASAVTVGNETEQVLTLQWSGTGVTAPFTSYNATSGFVPNLTTGLSTTHWVQTGPTFFDVTSAGAAPLTIVPDTTRTGQFAIGNPASTTDNVNVFQSFASYITQVGTVLNGTNTILKLVAVGSYNQTTGVFTAYRINMVQLP